MAKRPAAMIIGEGGAHIVTERGLSNVARIAKKKAERTKAAVEAETGFIDEVRGLLGAKFVPAIAGVPLRAEELNALSAGTKRGGGGGGGGGRGGGDDDDKDASAAASTASSSSSSSSADGDAWGTLLPNATQLWLPPPHNVTPIPGLPNVTVEIKPKQACRVAARSLLVEPQNAVKFFVSRFELTQADKAARHARQAAQDDKASAKGAGKQKRQKQTNASRKRRKTAATTTVDEEEREEEEEEDGDDDDNGDFEPYEMSTFRPFDLFSAAQNTFTETIDAVRRERQFNDGGEFGDEFIETGGKFSAPSLADDDDDVTLRIFRALQPLLATKRHPVYSNNLRVFVEGEPREDLFENYYDDDHDNADAGGLSPSPSSSSSSSSSAGQQPVAGGGIMEQLREGPFADFAREEPPRPAAMSNAPTVADVAATADTAAAAAAVATDETDATDTAATSALKDIFKSHLPGASSSSSSSSSSNAPPPPSPPPPPQMYAHPLEPLLLQTARVLSRERSVLHALAALQERDVLDAEGARRVLRRLAVLSTPPTLAAATRRVEEALLPRVDDDVDDDDEEEEDEEDDDGDDRQAAKRPLVVVLPERPSAEQAAALGWRLGQAMPGAEAREAAGRVVDQLGAEECVELLANHLVALMASDVSLMVTFRAAHGQPSRFHDENLYQRTSQAGVLLAGLGQRIDGGGGGDDAGGGGAKMMMAVDDSNDSTSDGSGGGGGGGGGGDGDGDGDGRRRFWPASGDEANERLSEAAVDASSLGPGDANGIAYTVMAMDLGPKPASKIETRGAKEDALCAMLPIPAQQPEAPRPARRLAVAVVAAPSLAGAAPSLAESSAASFPVTSSAALSSSSSSSSSSSWSSSSAASTQSKDSPSKRRPRSEPKQSKRRLACAPDRLARHESDGEVYSEVMYFEHTGGRAYATGIAQSTLRETLIPDLSTALSGEARKSAKKVCQRKSEFDSEEKRAKRFSECLARFEAQSAEAVTQPSAGAAQDLVEAAKQRAIERARARANGAAIASSPIMTSAPMGGEDDDDGDGFVVGRTMLI